MVQLFVKDKLVDLGARFKINFRRQNPAYLGTDVGSIKADFSYPFDLPMNARNRQVLGFPDRLDNAQPLPQNLPAILVVGGDTLLRGLINCRTATTSAAKVFFVNNPLAPLTKVKMNEVDIGSFAYASLDALQANMRDSTINPTARPWLAFPVYNGTLRERTDGQIGDSEFQNSYDFDTGNFRTNYPLSLFLRAEYVLRKLITANGYNWTDLFHVTNEHKRITLVNNRTLNETDGPVALAGLYQDLLPSTTVSDFLKHYCQLFCLAPFSSFSGDSITLQPLSGLLDVADARDWTRYASKGYQRATSNIISRFAFGEAALETVLLYKRWVDYGNPDYIRDDFRFPTVPGILDYNIRDASYIEYPIEGSNLVRSGNSFGSVNNPQGNEPLISQLDALQSSNFSFYDPAGGVIRLPAWSASLAPPEGDNQQQGSNDVSHRLTIYRGIQNTAGARPYPQANFNNYHFGPDPITGEKLSLRWIGENGLYQNHWAGWDAMLQEGSAVERNFRLPLAELIRFDFRDKVRIENKVYFVRNLEFAVSENGVSQTKCTLVPVA